MKMDINKDGGGAYNESNDKWRKLLWRYLEQSSKSEGFITVLT